MNNIDRTIKALNTALILLDAFVDGHEFTMHDYKQLAATPTARTSPTTLTSLKPTTRTSRATSILRTRTSKRNPPARVGFSLTN